MHLSLRYSIYIPVWIDLKFKEQGLSADEMKHLHSSMDRFEALRQPVSVSCSAIYIPVWIDLKGTKPKVNVPTKKIYIPVWIDLKRGTNM